MMKSRFLPSLAAGLIALLLVACDGENAYKLLPTEGSLRSDTRAPTVEIVQPDSGSRVPVRDSVLMEVRVQDNLALASVEFSGYAVRGNAALGTQTRVQRFETKLVVLDSALTIRDTTLVRYLNATGDSIAEDRVFLVATAKDRSGNTHVDSVHITLGGPSILVISPTAESQVRAGGPVRVRVRASDPTNRIQEVRVHLAGAANDSAVLALESMLTTVDTVVTLQLPASAEGDLQIRATARSGNNEVGTSSTTTVRLLPPAADTRAPTVRFSFAAAARAELSDSVSVTVVATDDVDVARVGITIVPIRRLSTGTVMLQPFTQSVTQDSATFNVSLAQLQVPIPNDTSSLRLEITAFAVDAAGNCAVATVPATELSEACLPGTEPIRGTRSGARSEMLVVRGATSRLASSDRIADMVVKGGRVYLSNISRNRLEVLPTTGLEFGTPILVGSQPWGLAFNRDSTRLYVANSGGTNISVVSRTEGREVDRIQTPNVKLYDIPYVSKLVPVEPESADSVSRLYPSSVTRRDYSDRPQFIGVTQNENLIFSTRPTAAARDGTVRIFRTAQRRLEVVTQYAEERVGSRLVLVNADSAFFVDAKPENLLQVCPRPMSYSGAQLATICLTGSIDEVQDSLRQRGYDTEFHYSVDIDEIGLSDTTFVAVSGDHSTVAMGEGARENGRVMLFVDPAGQTSGPLQKFGEIRDLVGNTAERVTGLALNSDGSLGAARGNEAYFFSNNLRLQGVVNTDARAGGIDLHPGNPGTPLAFVSGMESGGLAYIDVMHTLHFCRARRIFMRDPVTGPIRAVQIGGTLRIYAVTARGVASIDLFPGDLPAGGNGC